MNSLRETAYRIDRQWVREVLGEEPMPWHRTSHTPRGA
jgi:hypothetical protein